MIERKFVKDGLATVFLDKYLAGKLRKAGYAGVDIQKTPLVTRIIIKVERPGLVIGKKGKSIRELTDEIESKFGLQNVQIKVEEIPVPELDAVVMANRIARSLEKGLHFRRIMMWAIDKIMAAGALGAEIVISGKLVGKGGIARRERVARGYLKKAGEPSKQVRVAHAQALRKAGVIGVTVRIVPPDVVFPEKVDVEKEIAKKVGETSGNTKAEGSQSA